MEPLLVVVIGMMVILVVYPYVLPRRSKPDTDNSVGEGADSVDHDKSHIPIGVADLALRAAKNVRSLRAEQFRAEGMVDTTSLTDHEKIEISRLVDGVVAEASIVLGLHRRLVQTGPRLPEEETLNHILVGLRRYYSGIGMTDDSVESRIEQVFAVMTGTYARPLPRSANEHWMRIFRLLVPHLAQSDARFNFFATLVAKQNEILVPMLDDLLVRYSPRLTSIPAMPSDDR